MLRKLRFAVVLMLLIPFVAHAESDIAVVQASRMAWLNGTVIPQLSAIFPGDIIQTRTDLADIDAFGSKVRIWKDSLLTYRTNAVELERGGISVITSKAMGTQIEGLTVRPAAMAWTEFQVTNSDGAVHIVAVRGDLLVADDSGTTTVNAGQETTREVPKKKSKRRSAGAPPAGQGSVMDSKAAIIGAGIVAGGVTTWVLCRSDDPISPDTPRGGCF
jgi:hypothetical protein